MIPQPLPEPCRVTPGPLLMPLGGTVVSWERVKTAPGLDAAMGSVRLFCCLSPGPRIPHLPFGAEPVVGQHEPDSISCLQPRCRKALVALSLPFNIFFFFWCPF